MGYLFSNKYPTQKPSSYHAICQARDALSLISITHRR